MDIASLPGKLFCSVQAPNRVADPAQKPLMESLDRQIIAWQQSVGDGFQFADVLDHVSSFPS